MWFFSGVSAIFSKFLKQRIPRFRNSQNEGSLVSGIPKMRDPSNQEFQKRGIAREDGQQMAPLVAVWKVINTPIFDTQQALKILLCNLELMNPKYTKKIDNSLIFLAKKSKVKYTSLVSGIPDLRDPSIWEFLIWGIPGFRNSDLDGWGTWNKQVFWEVLLSFLSNLWSYTVFMYMTQIFWREIGPDLLFLVAGSTDTKFRRTW